MQINWIQFLFVHTRHILTSQKYYIFCRVHSPNLDRFLVSQAFDERVRVFRLQLWSQLLSIFNAFVMVSFLFVWPSLTYYSTLGIHDTAHTCGILSAPLCDVMYHCFEAYANAPDWSEARVKCRWVRKNINEGS